MRGYPVRDSCVRYSGHKNPNCPKQFAFSLFYHHCSFLSIPDCRYPNLPLMTQIMVLSFSAFSYQKFFFQHRIFCKTHKTSMVFGKKIFRFYSRFLIYIVSDFRIWLFKFQIFIIEYRFYKKRRRITWSFFFFCCWFRTQSLLDKPSFLVYLSEKMCAKADSEYFKKHSPVFMLFPYPHALP